MRKERFGKPEEPTKEQVDEVRREVDKLVEQGKVYRDDQGRIWPITIDKGRA